MPRAPRGAPPPHYRRDHIASSENSEAPSHVILNAKRIEMFPSDSKTIRDARPTPGKGKAKPSDQDATSSLTKSKDKGKGKAKEIHDPSSSPSSTTVRTSEDDACDVIRARLLHDKLNPSSPWTLDLSRTQTPSHTPAQASSSHIPPPTHEAADLAMARRLQSEYDAEFAAEAAQAYDSEDHSEDLSARTSRDEHGRFADSDSDAEVDADADMLGPNMSCILALASRRGNRSDYPSPGLDAEQDGGKEEGRAPSSPPPRRDKGKGRAVPFPVPSPPPVPSLTLMRSTALTAPVRGQRIGAEGKEGKERGKARGRGPALIWQGGDERWVSLGGADDPRGGEVRGADGREVEGGRRVERQERERGVGVTERRGGREEEERRASEDEEDNRNRGRVERVKHRSLEKTRLRPEIETQRDRHERRERERREVKEGKGA